METDQSTIKTSRNNQPRDHLHPKPSLFPTPPPFPLLNSAIKHRVNYMKLQQSYTTERTTCHVPPYLTHISPHTDLPLLYIPIITDQETNPPFPPLKITSLQPSHESTAIQIKILQPNDAHKRKSCYSCCDILCVQPDTGIHGASSYSTG